MHIEFGKHQVLTSPRMSKSPKLAKLIRTLFGYTNVGNYARAKVFMDLMDQLPTEEFRRILDLGCGFGEYTFMLSEKLNDANITALDTDGQKIEQLNKIIHKEGIHSIDTFTGMIQNYKEDGFDFIFSIDVFEHILVEHMPFKAAYERLKPGGFLLVKMPSKEQITVLPDDWFKEHQEWLDDEHIGQVYELEDLKNRFKEEGFQITYAAYSDGWWSRLGWEIGHLSRKAGAAAQLATLPLAKAMVAIDRKKSHLKKGNTIQVIGQKI